MFRQANKKSSKFAQILKADPKKIHHLFDIEDEEPEVKPNLKIKIKYNETVFFNPVENKTGIDDHPNLPKEKELTKIINNVINSTITKGSSENPSIKVNLNINNNYYNSNYNYVVSTNTNTNTIKNDNKNGNDDKTNDEGGNDVSGFLKKVFTFSNDNMESNLNANLNENTEINSNSQQDVRPTVSRSKVPNTKTRMSTTSVQTNESVSRKSHISNLCTNFLYIPCINCNNLIHVEEIENHSLICTRVKEEVIVAESTHNSYQSIDFKLKKLQEHINIIKNSNSSSITNEVQKDIHYISLLLQYIVDAIAICKIDHKAIADLKKILTNIDTLSVTHKGSMSTLVLIERTRVLVYDKISIFKEDYKKLLQTKKLNERKSGNLNALKIVQLEKEKEEKTKLAEKLEAEKEMMLRKVNNLKKTPEIMRKSASSIFDRKKIPDLNEDISANNIEIDEDEEEEMQRLDSNKIFNKKNVVEDIDSDLENRSVRSVEFSDCTSMTSSASIAEGLKMMEQMERNTINEYMNNKGSSQNNSLLQNSIVSESSKKMYQEFVKLMLKVKFEKFNNSHSGQKIPEKVLYKECIRQQIHKQHWTEFIINELQQPAKYSQYIKKDNKLKNYKQYIGANMEVINEEI